MYKNLEETHERDNIEYHGEEHEPNTKRHYIWTSKSRLINWKLRYQTFMKRVNGSVLRRFWNNNDNF